MRLHDVIRYDTTDETEAVRFQWNARKATANLAKHKVSFDETSTVFGDPLAVTINDPDSSADENRLLTKGMSQRWRLLVVAHT